MEFTPIARGFYLEALAVDADAVWYSDVITGGLQQLTSDGATKSYLPGKQWIGGLRFNAGGFVLHSGPGGIGWVHAASGRAGMLLDRIDGQPVDGVNEMVPDGNGGLYFGTLDISSIIRGQITRPVALYHLSVDGQVTRQCDGIRFSNSLGLSPDGRTLYHNVSFVGTFSHAVAAGGALGPARLLLDKPDCDGMAVDTRGNLWISGFRSPELLCLQPDGRIVDRLAVPGDAVTNLRFGGADGRDLYVTTVPGDAGARIASGKLPETPGSVLYRGRAPVAGLVVPPTRLHCGA